jgi:DNA-binding XRE family transcriptional regulator
MDETIREMKAPARREVPPVPAWARRKRPRDYVEWKTLRRWGQLPPWEPLRPGYLLRLAREAAGLSQADLARRLEVTQQAVARAERWSSNPTVALMERWAVACEAELTIGIEPRGSG